MDTVISVKGFTQDFRSYDIPGVAEIGKTYVLEESLDKTALGFHAVDGNPVQVLDYFPFYVRYALVEQSGIFKKSEKWSNERKMFSSSIKIIREIDAEEVLELTKKWEENSSQKFLCFPLHEKSLYAADDEGSCSVTDKPNSCSFSVKSESRGTAITKEKGSIAASICEHPLSMSFKEDSISVTHGTFGTSFAKGENSIAVAIGDGSRSFVSGEGGVAFTHCADGSAVCNSKNGIAISTSFDGYAKGVLGSFLVLAYRNPKGEFLHVWSAEVGKNGIKPDVFYYLDEDGKPQELLNIFK